MENSRIKNGINIIKYAIEKKISLRAASVEKGYSATYLKNIKLDLNKEERENRIKNVPLFDEFKKQHKQYKLLPLNNTQNNPTITCHQQDNILNIESRGRIKTLEQLLDAAKVDLVLWRVKDYIINKWDTSSHSTGGWNTVENFQVKVRLERNQDVHEERIIGDILEKTINNYTFPVLKTYKPLVVNNNPHDEENNLLEVSIFDLHLGKLAWSGETGENFDTKIASARFIEAIEQLVYRATSHRFDRILFPIGNDFFNSDNIQNTTTNGTPQDEDLRWQKTFDVGLNLLVDGINLLKQTGRPVDVLVIPGNHDFQRSYYIGSCLSAWFRNDSCVNINNGASPRKYYRFGEVLLGFTHGKYEKEASLPMLMASEEESKKMWSETKFREWHLGHIHRKRNINYTVLDKSRVLSEDFGVVVRYLSSLTGTEEWHHKMGFVGQIKAADGFLWNDKVGLIAHFNSNITIK